MDQAADTGPNPGAGAGGKSMATRQIHIEIPCRAATARRSCPPAAAESGGEPAAPPGAQEIFGFAARYAADRRRVRPGGELFGEDESPDRLYVVLDGWLCMYRVLEDGRRQILDFALPGAVVGYRGRTDRPVAYSVGAVTEAEVASVTLMRVHALLGDGAWLAGPLLDAASDALLDAFDTLTDVGRRKAHEAVAHFLLRMERRVRFVFGASEDGSVPFPLCQAHIGDALGLTAVHVCRMLGRLRDDRLIEIGRGRLRILRPEALSEIACLDAAGMAAARPLNGLEERS